VIILKNPHIFFRWVGNPLQCDQSEKSSYFSAGLGTHYNVTTFEKTLYLPPWAGNTLQCDRFQKILVLFPLGW
jgi:hypothetical protein